jgi:asparagine synthase (glutamine-hydrolysing)
MPTLRLSISDPDVLVVERPEAAWFLSGFGKSDVQQVQVSNEVLSGTESELARRVGDATILKIHLSSGRATAIEVWKPAISSRDIFYCQTSDGDTLLSDHFRTVLSQLPPVDRRVAEDSIIDFFLFNTVPGTRTICSAINRLGQGETLSIDLASRQIRSSIFDQIESHEMDRSTASYLDSLDAALSDVVAPLKREEGIANLFSGGVDSVLIHTYLGNAVPGLHMKFESLEIDSPYETGYAQHAADLMGLDLRTHLIEEADYLDHLEQTTSALGRPPLFLAMIFYDRAFRQDYRTYVSGEAAVQFGDGAHLARAASYFSSPLGIALLKTLTPRIPASARPAWRLLLPRAIELSEDPYSSLGYGARSALDTNIPLMERVFGSEMVRHRLDARLEYLLQRLVPAAPRTQRFFQHVEVEMWVEYLLSDHRNFCRQLAQSHSKSLAMPFASGRVTSAALEIPVISRYIKGLQAKYLLKQLLRRRLPDYPVSQRKAYSHVSFRRYYESGPLCKIWDRYQPPDFLDEVSRNLVLNKASPLTWHAIAYAVWRDRVLDDPDLAPAPSHCDREWTSGKQLSIQMS